MWKTKFGTCIYTSASGYKVYQNWFYRWLTLGSNALQTVISRRKPYKPILYYLPALTLMVKKNPAPTCLLGLGGAGIPLMLHKIPIIAVDTSLEVIDIAQQFFMVKDLKELTIIHDNAVNYVQKCQSIFTHLIIDLYNAHCFPPECCTEEFFSACKNIMTKDGFLAINLANVKEQWPVFQLVKSQFTHTLVIPIKNSANIVIIASNLASNDLFIQKINEAGLIKKIIWMPDWGFVTESENMHF